MPKLIETQQLVKEAFYQVKGKDVYLALPYGEHGNLALFGAGGGNDALFWRSDFQSWKPYQYDHFTNQYEIMDIPVGYWWPDLQQVARDEYGHWVPVE